MRVPYTCMRIDGRKYKFPAKMIAKTKDRKGYLNVSLLLESGKRKSFKVHRLVANAFIKNPKNKPQVNHKDSDKTNNHVSNLEWVNQQENMEHSVMAGTKWTKPVRCVNDGLIFRSMRSAARYYGVGHKEISKCCNGVLAATKGKKFEFVSKEDAVDGIYRTTRANNAFNGQVRWSGNIRVGAHAYHPANGGLRDGRTAAILQQTGVKPGVPDVCLPAPRGGHGALFIEMKKARGGVVSANQKVWINRLNEAGNKAVVCRGWEQARDVIVKYLEGA